MEIKGDYKVYKEKRGTQMIRIPNIVKTKAKFYTVEVLDDGTLIYRPKVE
jgi:hypothetical protein